MAKAEEKKVEEVKKAESVKEAKKVEQKPIVAKPKYVKVKSKVNGKRFIGGQWYSLERDKEVDVTEDAKRSLLQAGAIYL
jgi:hypothetical protein